MPQIESGPTTQQPEPMLASKADVAHMLCLSMRSVHELIHTGALPAIRIGGRVLVRVSDVKQFVDSRPAVANA